MAASKREKELARQRAERQAARRAAAAARRKQRSAVLAAVLGVGALAVVLALLASRLGSSSSQAPLAQPGPTGVSTPASSAPATSGCSYDDAGTPARKVPKPPTQGVETSGTYVATLTMNVGTVAFTMNAAKTPCTVNSIRSLAHFSYFDKTPCHRLTTRGIFVLQCGDPSGDGTGGPGYRFADENLTGATYPRGTVAMANSGAGTNGSQFFLVYKDSQLPPDYTPFGTITAGLDVLDRVAKGGSTTPGDGKPVIPVTITTFRTSAKA